MFCPGHPKRPGSKRVVAGSDRAHVRAVGGGDDLEPAPRLIDRVEQLIHRGVERERLQQLIDALNTALEDFDRNGLNRARPTAQSIGLTPAQLTDYFSALTYRLGPDEIAGEEQFHRLWQDSERRVGC